MKKKPNPVVNITDLKLYYGNNLALNGINLDISEKMITAFIGPSGCGKSTLIRCLNRMNDLIEGVRIEGSIKIAGKDKAQDQDNRREGNHLDYCQLDQHNSPL